MKQNAPYCKSITITQASDYSRLSKESEACVFLLLYPNNQHIKIIPLFEELSTVVAFYVVPVTHVEADTVSVIRLPRIRVFLRGAMVENTLLNMNDISEMERVAKRLFNTMAGRETR